jgi:diguanylate cyclase
VISSVAACLRQRLRPRDFVARHVGAAFTILLPRAPSTAALVVAERLRSGVAEMSHDVTAAQVVRVTIAIGCVTLERGGLTSRQQVVEAATRALGAAKRSGGDRIVTLVDKTGESLDRPAAAV